MLKKIVFVVERLSTGGAERVVAALANEICNLSNYESYIVTYHPKEENEYYKNKQSAWQQFQNRTQQKRKRLVAEGVITDRIFIIMI